MTGFVVAVDCVVVAGYFYVCWQAWNSMRHAIRRCDRILADLERIKREIRPVGPEPIKAGGTD